MEVVLLLLGIVGIALVAVPRIQRRSSSVAVAPRAVGARPSRSASAPPPRPPPRLRPRLAAPSPVDEDAWDDDLGWEGVEEPPPGHSRGVGALARRPSRRSPAEEPEDAPPSRSPSCRASSAGARRPQEDDEWLEDDDGLGWEGRGRRSGSVQRRRSRRATATGIVPHAGVDASAPATGRARTRARPRSPPWHRPGRARDESRAGRARRGFRLRRDRRRAGARRWLAARTRSRTTGTTEPVARAVGRSRGRPTTRRREARPRPAGKRKLHPVAAAGDLRRRRDRAGRAGQHDAARRLHERAGRAPPDARAAATAEPTPEPTGSVVDDPAAAEAAAGRGSRTRSRRRRRKRAFERYRTRALAARRDAVNRARAAERRERSRAATRDRRGQQHAGQGSGGGAAPSTGGSSTRRRPAAPGVGGGSGGGSPAAAEAAAARDRTAGL